MQKMIEVRIPFQGFYESIAGREAEDLAFIDWPGRDEGETHQDELEGDRADHFNDWYCDNYKQYEAQIAELYIVNLFEEIRGKTGYDCRPDLKSILIDSPRQYNFGTDRLFVNVPASKMIKLFNAVDKNILMEEVKENFTSYDGFISHYENDIAKFGPAITWDHNQWAVVIESLIKQYDIDTMELLWN
jgi:hypothetical protein